MTSIDSLKRLYLFALFSSLTLTSATALANENALQIRANMVRGTPEALLEVVDRAKAAGATSVQYSDTKLNRYGAKWRF